MEPLSASQVAQKAVLAFPSRLKNLREEAGLTQEELAEKAQISARAVSRYETGEAIPDLRIIHKLAWGLGCDSCELVVLDST